MIFHDRFEAGQQLAGLVAEYKRDRSVLVLALPRGGVPVAYEVAKELSAPLDVMIVRKLGYPLQPELAMGAIATGEVLVLHDDVVESLGISERLIEQAAERELQELKRQELLFRGRREPPQVAGRTVILVDDGLATGSTMRAAVKALKKQGPRRLVVAVPVGAPQTCAQFNAEVDQVICFQQPDQFRAVGMWYDDFTATSDEMVQRLLIDARHWAPVHV